MEKNLEYAIINIPNIATNPIDDEKPKPIENNSPKRKNGGGLRFLKVALHRIRGRSSKSNFVNIEQDDDASKSISTLKNFVGSMRPLLLQSNVHNSPCSVSEPANGGYVSDSVSEEEPYHSPYSPSPASSRYASAIGLNELVQHDENIEKHNKEELVQNNEEIEKTEVIIEKECNEEHGDEMIDTKAEEFITRFYQQMNLQRMDSVDRRYFERHERSLG